MKTKIVIITLLLLVLCGVTIYGDSFPLNLSDTDSAVNEENNGDGVFSNKYGIQTTKCAHPGCDNFITTSGDSNCCEIHSARCLNCHKYVDEDALYCLDCYETLLKKNKTDSKTNYTTSQLMTYKSEEANKANNAKKTTASTQSSNNKSGSNSSALFTNKYGNPMTKCAHPGCNNYIASSGDTNCCTIHSNRCLDCNKYIDEDAMYCIDCLSSALTSSNNKTSSKSTASFTNKYGTPTTKCHHPGCNNYIASSGDTNCCTIHSNRCLECNKYIDEDAMYCLDCLMGN